nr:MAG TPA: hypothetical protein [Caudoviricetes sp.]
MQKKLWMKNLVNGAKTKLQGGGSKRIKQQMILT